MSQEQNSLAELIYALNETMVGKLDALNDRISELESRLESNVLDLSGLHENQFESLLQKMQDSGTVTNYGDAQKNWPIFHIYSIVWDIAVKNGLDPQSTTQLTQEFLSNPKEFLRKHSPPASNT